MYGSCTSPEHVLDLIRSRGIQIVDLRFTDLPGTWQHVSLPASELSSADFERGIGFDGSSIRGFQVIQESDTFVVPDPTTAVIDPFAIAPALAMRCAVVDPPSRQPSECNRHSIVQRSDRYLRVLGFAATNVWGSASAWFVLDHVRVDVLSPCPGRALDRHAADRGSGSGDKRAEISAPRRCTAGTRAAFSHETRPDRRRGLASIVEWNADPVETQSLGEATVSQGEIEGQRAAQTAISDLMTSVEDGGGSSAGEQARLATARAMPLARGRFYRRSVRERYEPITDEERGCRGGTVRGVH